MSHSTSSLLDSYPVILDCSFDSNKLKIVKQDRSTCYIYHVNYNYYSDKYKELRIKPTNYLKFANCIQCSNYGKLSVRLALEKSTVDQAEFRNMVVNIVNYLAEQISKEHNVPIKLPIIDDVMTIKIKSSQIIVHHSKSKGSITGIIHNDITKNNSFAAFTEIEKHFPALCKPFRETNISKDVYFVCNTILSFRCVVMKDALTNNDATPKNGIFIMIESNDIFEIKYNVSTIDSVIDKNVSIWREQNNIKSLVI